MGRTVSPEMIAIVAAGAALAGSVAGVFVGLWAGAHVREELRTENRVMREALRYVHRVTAHHPHVGALARYIELVLEEPTGT